LFDGFAKAPKNGIPMCKVNLGDTFDRSGMRSRKILLSAFACEPGKGSEPGVGWNWARELSGRVELHVVTRANNRFAIEASGEPWVKDVRWLYFDLPRWASWWKRGARGANLYYALWQAAFYFVARRMHARVRFDLVHHVTFGRYWVPCWAGLLPVPFVFGPVGGAEETPSGLRGGRSLGQRVVDFSRNLMRVFARFDPVLRSSIGKPNTIAVAATPETGETLRRYRPARIELMPQCALDVQLAARLGSLEPAREGPFRVISIGRLVHWKGYHLGLRAFAELVKRHPDSEYWLVNDGPEMAALRLLAIRLGIADTVTFWGKLSSLDEVYGKLEQSHVLLHPALHEAFGNVCLEAMAAGRPVVCLNGGGPGLQVTPETGFSVCPDSEDKTVNGLSKALTELAFNPDMRLTMGEAAKKRATQEFAWERRAWEMMKMYESVVDRRKKAEQET
jgi:glycosyltransferase involved in cell wall biosynthesis